MSPDKLLEDGLTFYGLGKVEEAVELWKRVLELSPDHPLALEYLGIAKEDMDGGEKKAEPPPVAAPSASYADDLRMGIALMKEERFEDAQSAFQSALSKKKEDPYVHGYGLLAVAHRLEKYMGVIGDLSAAPKLAQDLDHIKTMKISKEAGFILSFVDGALPYEDILALARMNRLDAMGHIAQLIESGAIRS